MEDIGGKASSLIILKDAGFKTPDFFILSFKEILNSSLEELEKKILEKTKNWGRGIILRSSASCEDGKENSFAGLFESIKLLNKSKIKQSLKQILNSANSKRLRDYLKSRGIKTKPRISVIVQKFILGEISGVIFNAKKEYVLNSNFGTAESIVQGQACDEYLINKENHQITLKNKVANSLKKEQINQITKIADKINKIFQSPQDIEWTIKGHNLYILQSRPITIFQKNPELIVWDSSNIAESYSGIVLPLTCSFAKEMYSKVYGQVAIASGVSKRRIENYGKVFDNMLGFFYGRFYYHMPNWYKMLTLFPGYERNKINFDRMISAKSKAELDMDYKKNVNLIFKMKYYPLILFKYLYFDSAVIQFKKTIAKIKERFNSIKIEELSRLELLAEFARLEKILISVWHIPIENDFLAMTFHGFLIKKAKSLGIEDIKITNQISHIANLKTAEQIRALTLLAQNPTSKNIEKYFESYGGRFVNELKLESAELTRESKDFFKLLKSYRAIKVKEPPATEKLNFGFFGNFFLSETKKYLGQREELRILRAQVFSIARKIFIEIGKRMEEKRMISNYRDVFYLNLSELYRALPKPNFKMIVNKRKEEYRKYKKISPGNIIYTDTAGNIINKFVNLAGSYDNSISGRPCSVGEISGKASLIKNSKPSLSRKYEIVVTETADPGWAPILNLCKGIIIEKGGVLSHISILARELGVPCIINVPGIMQKIKNNESVYMNGSTGEIKIDRNN
jgi:pyruvate,water dikinase